MRMRSYGACVVTSSPKKRTRPSVAGKSPVITLKSVVLPAPLAPMTARRSPAATESETFSIARRAPNVRVTCSSTSASPATGLWLEGTQLWTVGLVPRPDLELLRVGAERLRHVIDLLQHLVVQVALLVLHHLGDKRRADCLTVFIQLDVAHRGLERHLREGFAILLLPV